MVEEVYVGSMGPGLQWDPVTENHVVPVHRKMCKYTIIPRSPGPIEHRVPLNPRIPLLYDDEVNHPAPRNGIIVPPNESPYGEASSSSSVVERTIATTMSTFKTKRWMAVGGCTLAGGAVLGTIGVFVTGPAILLGLGGAVQAVHVSYYHISNVYDL